MPNNAVLFLKMAVIACLQVDIQPVLTPGLPQSITVSPAMPYTPGQPAWQPQAPNLILPQQRAASSSANSTNADDTDQ